MALINIELPKGYKFTSKYKRKKKEGITQISLIIDLPPNDVSIESFKDLQDNYKLIIKELK